MTNKVIDLFCKLIALGLVFVAPMIYIWWKYGGSETQVIEVTTNSMPIPILILLSVFAIMFVAFIFSQTLNAIQDAPFGYGSILFFGSLIAIISLIGFLWLAKLSDLIEYNAQQFLVDLDIYKHSVMIILAYIMAGLTVALGGFIYKKTI